MADDQTHAEEYQLGYQRPEPPQVPPGRDGDPQIAAIATYLQSKTGLPSDAIIVDFGSGEGVLPYWINRVWPNDRAVPTYHAVDLPQPLDSLRIPARIHNRSRKVSLDEFHGNYLDVFGSKISLVVIRNVMHELGLRDSAMLLSSLTRGLGRGVEIFVQDMVNLPRVEPGRAGWDSELLHLLFQQIGTTSHLLDLSSHNGTKWFTLQMRASGVAVSFERCLALCAAARKAQRDRLLKNVRELNEEGQKETGYLRVVLQNDVTTIALQLEKDANDIGKLASPPIEAVAMSAMGLTVRVNEAGPLDYAIAATGNASQIAGLAAVLSNKRMLHIPELLGKCQNFAYFAGYSLHSLFEDPAAVEAVVKIVSEGKSLRLLLVDPRSSAASARSAVPAYSTLDELTTSIALTLSRAVQVAKSLCDQIDEEQVRNCLEVALSPWTPPCSYFVVDDICVVSLYSAHLTGSSGSCFVFRAGDSAVNSYYRVLLDDFNATWRSEKTVRVL